MHLHLVQSADDLRVKKKDTKIHPEMFRSVPTAETKKVVMSMPTLHFCPVPKAF